MDPTFAIAGLTWVTTNVTQGAPVAWCLGSILGGILGNEAHRLYREKPGRIAKALVPLTVPENHDLARAVRTAEIDALERLGMDYRDAHRADWDAVPGTRPTAFLHHVDRVLRDARSRLASAAFDQSITDNLRGAFEGLLSEPEAGGAAAERTQLLAGLAEDAVLEEVCATLGTIPFPRNFATYFRHGMGDRPRFLDLFAAFFAEQIKPDMPARAIFAAKLLTRVEGLAYDSTAIVRRIEIQFGGLLADIKGDTKELLVRTEKLMDGQDAVRKVLEGIARGKGVSKAPLTGEAARDGDRPRRDDDDAGAEDKSPQAASKAILLLSLDERLNSKDMQPLFSYFSLITDFVNSELKRDHNSNLPLAITNNPGLRLWLAKQVDLINLKDKDLFVQFVSLCRILDTVAGLWKSRILSDSEVRAFIGSTLTVFGSLIPDALARFARGDKNTWNFSDRVRELFGLIPDNQSFLQVPCPTDSLTPDDEKDKRHLEFWDIAFKLKGRSAT